MGDEGPAEAPPGAEEEEEEEEEEDEEKWPNRQTRRTANPPQKPLASPASQNNRCTLQKQTLRPSREIFSVEIYKCFKFMFMGYTSSRQQTNYFPLCAI